MRGLTASRGCVTIGYSMKPTDLRRIREQLGLTLQQLAEEALRTTRVSVARYEAGMRRIPGMVKVAIDRLGRAPEIPMAGMVAAGLIEPVQQSELIDVPPSMLQGGKTFALRVKGESMKDDGILPGDLIVVRKQETAQSGQTVVALVNGEATVKTYFKKATHIELRLQNTTMPPILVQASDEFHIEGVLIGVIRHCTT